MPRQIKEVSVAVVDDYVRACLEARSAPQVKELSQQLRISRGELSRLFRSIAHITLRRYLRLRTVETAKELLTSTNTPLDEIARACGFGTRRSFFRAFKRTTGLTPAAYRAQKVTRPQPEPDPPPSC